MGAFERAAGTALSVKLGVGVVVPVGFVAVPHIRALRGSATANTQGTTLDPLTFSAGACLSLVPSSTPSGKIVLLDAGTGESIREVSG